MAENEAEKTATLVQVARLYYYEGLSQQEIADQLGVSRSLIANYLQTARERQIVRIEVIDPQDNCTNLAFELQHQAGIEKVVVVPHGHMSDVLTRRAIAAAAAKFLEQWIHDGDVVGLGWGRTMTRAVELIAPNQPRNIDVVALLGESSHTSSYSQMNHLVLQTAQHFGGRPHFLLAPMVVSSNALRTMLYADSVVHEVVEQWDRLTIASFGIGVLPPPPGMIPYIGEEYLPMLQERGAVGDVCVHPFSAQGEIIETELTGRMIGVSIEQLRKTPCRIAVAAGVEKTTATLGALRTGLITHLFVDAQLAEALLAAL